ncbi:hypothetical protein METBIDRAFT_148209 [Metschnikowia bicuspidata var. bicuspidata NRRL YB-4993]|uniref:AN1-type domain-containing protein n=1 Tax=Metschnikowia bicuspidata var. bicuspidata NRRL YB-4993 TaxID=869754 RepID=A0A1A0HE48_9ASCO|nr:hypothetical protein METBIDRAFT_148209 [Metschnikowia bicuspidata var. bicuspidata NRRL YB-4993]OBA22177.1 hypothetical protein METBIDRAFT_148209 [Metschnikowia bicuspidata var. bicuspidata NRRL YB-4993]
MKVTFRLSTESSFSVTIPHNSTVEDLRNAAKVGCPSSAKLPLDFKLIYNGVKLAPYYKTLDALSVRPEEDSITVILMSEGSDTPIASPQLAPVENVAVAPRKKAKKNRCSFKSCSASPLRMVGDCGQCNGKFCAKHRLLEDHLCSGLQFCKDNAHERNAMKLQNESTIASRV